MANGGGTGGAPLALCLSVTSVLLPGVPAPERTLLEPDWLATLGAPLHDERALTLGFLAHGDLIAGGVNSTDTGTAGFRMQLATDGREVSRDLTAYPTVSIAPDSRGYNAVERRPKSDFAIASYRGN